MLQRCRKQQSIENSKVLLFDEMFNFNVENCLELH